MDMPSLKCLTATASQVFRDVTQLKLVVQRGEARSCNAWHSLPTRIILSLSGVVIV